MKVCFYAINGHGLGHLSRCHAIARQTRKLLMMLGRKPDIQILTTSEADYIIRDFPVFKIPSRANFKGRKAASSRYSSNGKMMVSSMLSHFSPDVLVMDTIATGSFHEFTFIKSFAKKSTLIERHKNTEYSSSPTHQTHLKLFDRLIIPDEPEHLGDYILPDGLRDQVTPVGMIHSYDDSESLSRNDVRRYFNAPEDRPLVYLAAGGGGDASAASQIDAILAELLKRNVIVVIGYGPLSLADKHYGQENAIVFTEPNIRRYFKGFDLAISAAGYNSYEELLAARTPSLFFPQDKGLDLQERRIRQGLKKEWHGELLLSKKIGPQLEQALASKPGRMLKSRQKKLGACEAAKTIIALHLDTDENQLIELELTTHILKLNASGKWVSKNPVDSYHLYRSVYLTADPAIRMKENLQFLTSFENGIVPDQLLVRLCQADTLNKTLNGYDYESSTQRNQMVRHLATLTRSGEEISEHHISEFLKSK